MTSVQEYFEMAATANSLPAGFNQWELADREGWTVAHMAARFGNLPEGFDQWTLEDNEGWTVAHEAAENGHLPEGFDLWDLADEKGWTVADEAKICGKLHEKQNGSNQQNGSNLTLRFLGTQISANDEFIERPDMIELFITESFVNEVEKLFLIMKEHPEIRYINAGLGETLQFGLYNIDNEAGRRGVPAFDDEYALAKTEYNLEIEPCIHVSGQVTLQFPLRHSDKMFEMDLGFVSNLRQQIDQAAPNDPLTEFYFLRAKAVKGTLMTSDVSSEKWALQNENGFLLAHVCAELGILPEGFNQWELREDGISVAHVAAMYGHLPEEFDQWDLTDDSETTVLEIAKAFGHTPKSKPIMAQ